MPEPLSRRQTLLHHNAGVWEGTFIRLNAGDHEIERFGSHRQVLIAVAVFTPI